MIESVSKSDPRDRRREVIDRLIEVEVEGEVLKRGGKVVNGLVEVVAKSEVGEREGEVVDGEIILFSEL